MAFLTKKLVTIAVDVPMSKDMSSYRRGPMKEQELQSFLQGVNFKTIEKTLLSTSSEPTTKEKTTMSHE